MVHLHSCHSVALSLLPGQDADDFLPPLTPYAIMKLGRVALLPFYLPGSAELGDAIRGVAGKRSAVMLAHHGPVVAGRGSRGRMQRYRGIGRHGTAGPVDQGMQAQHAFWRTGKTGGGGF